MAGVEQLYKNYGILADAGDKISEHEEAYKGLLAAAKGSEGEKRLAAGFITKFSRHFHALADTTMDRLLDLIEDEDAKIRHTAIKCLPDLCTGNEDFSIVTRVTDVLTQLLLSDDTADVALVKSTMAKMLLMDTQRALVGIFDQIMGEDEAVRDKAIEYVSVSLMDMRHKLFIQCEHNEKFLVELVKKVLSDVTGEEFEVFIELLGKLQHLSSPDGSQQIISIIAEQAELSEDFQADSTELIERFVTCFRLALKFCKKGGSSCQFIQYLCTQIIPVLSDIPEEQTQHSVLQLLAEGSYYLHDGDDVTACLPLLHSFLLDHMPVVSEEGGASDTPKLQFSVVECALFGFHQLVKKCPEFLVGADNAERLKEFRQRLQYFARGCQTYHGQLQAALKGKSALELKEEQNKLRQVALKTTANISAIIKDFFHNPPSYKTVVQLSWGAKRIETPTQAGVKRPTQAQSASAKRKPSPIRFDIKSSGTEKKQSRELYHPPRDQFSKKFSNGDFENVEYYGGRGRRGRGRGRGGRRGRGGAWKVY